MNLIALTACFLFVFCHGPRHASVAKSSPPVVVGQQDARGKSCAQITKDFDGNQDDWVSKFPVAQQHRVLVCLGKLVKPGDQ